METFTIRIAGDDLAFSAAHFITFDDGACEPLHGHTYRASAEVELPLGPAGYTIDFAVVQRTLRSVLDAIDHRVLLPGEHPRLRLRASDDEIEASLGSRRWVFPRDNCAVLPMANVTAELMARHVGQSLLERLRAESGCRATRLRLLIEESCGQSAAWEIREG